MTVTTMRLALVGALALYSAAADAKSPPPGILYRNNPQAAADGDPSFFVRKMPNGLELVMVPSAKVPLATIVIAAKAGAMTETPDINGLTHLWEHMFFKGNKRLPNQEAFMNRVRELGIMFNGDTSSEVVRYFFTLPSAYLDEGLQFMSDAIATPLLEQNELERERRVVLDEYDRDASSPSFDRDNLTRVLTYGPNDYRRDALGKRKVVESATREQLLRIKSEVFTPGNCALLVGGDFDKATLPSLVEKHFGSWANPQGWKPVSRPEITGIHKPADFVMTRKDVENADVQITFAGPRALIDQKDTYPADLLSRMLGHKNGRFYKKFVDSGLTLSAGAGYFTQADAGDFSIFASMQPSRAKEVREMLLKEIAEWRRPGYFTQEQFEDAKRGFQIERKFELNKISEYTKSLAFWWAIAGLDYYSGYLDRLQATHMSDVQAFVSRWLVKKPYVSSIFMSPESAGKVGLVDNSAGLAEVRK
ncbi:insulinase family protein [bacterium]|nr:insulinase family protein [bacterium]